MGILSAGRAERVLRLWHVFGSPLFVRKQCICQEVLTCTLEGASSCWNAEGFDQLIDSVLGKSSAVTIQRRDHALAGLDDAPAQTCGGDNGGDNGGEHQHE